MAKRFMATDIFDDPWFIELSPEYKLFWIYLLLRCNHAGIWQVNFKLANFHLFGLDTKVSEKEALELFKGRIEVLKQGYWRIVKFVEFQYGELGNSNVHQSVKKELQRFGIMDEDESNSEPTLEDVIKYFDSLGFSKTEAENFYSYYSAQNWETKSGVSIKKRWRNKVIGFINNQKNFAPEIKVVEKSKSIPSSPYDKPITGKCICGKPATIQVERKNVCSFECYYKLIERRNKND